MYCKPCPYYMEQTKNLRTDMKLLISCVKPHKPICSSTLAGWCMHMLQWAGINTTVFSSHSTRSAAGSRINNLGVSFKGLAKAAGWSEKSKTFAVHYNKPINTNISEVIMHGFEGSNNDNIDNTL